MPEDYPEPQGLIPQYLRYYLVRLAILIGLLAAFWTPLLLYADFEQLLSEAQTGGLYEWVLPAALAVGYYWLLDPYVTGAPAGHIVLGNWRDGVMTWVGAIGKVMAEMEGGIHA
jgi:hypothetical protein